MSNRSNICNEQRWVPRVQLVPPGMSPTHVDRTFLLGPATAWQQSKLILVQAPAGFGKTVLLSQLHAQLAATQCRRIWMSLSEDEWNADALLGVLSAAISATFKLADVAPSPDVPTSQRERMALERIIRSLDAQDRDIWIFIDNVRGADALYRLTTLRKLIRLTGDNVHFVLSSRFTLDIGVSHLRPDGKLRELGSQELSFTREQVAEVLGETLDASELDQVLADTRGWPVAVCLIKSCLDGGGVNYATLVRQGRAQREMFEYLTEQILAGLPADLQELLLVTSIFDRIDALLINAVLRTNRGQPWLQELLDRHLPIEPCADAPGFYKYHSLFAEFLRSTVAQRAPDKRRAAHAVGARWFAVREQWAEALHHGFHAVILPEILDALERAGGVRIALRYGHRVLRPLANLELHITHSHPLCRLGQIYYWTLEGQTAGARAALTDLERRLDALGDGMHAQRVALDIQMVDLLVSVYEERQISLEAIQRLECTMQAARAAEESFVVTAAGGLVIVAYFQTFQFERCRQVVQELLFAYRDARSPYSETFMHVYAVLLELEQGRLVEAECAVERMSDHIRKGLGPQDPLCQLAELFHAEIAYESGEFDRAIAKLERARLGFGLGAAQGWFELQMQLLRAASLILLRTRGLDAALGLLEDADASTAALGRHKGATACALHRANLLLRAGEWPAARPIVESEQIAAVLAGPLEPSHPWVYLRVYAGELRAELALIDDEPAHAAEELASLASFARTTKWSAALARIAILEAAARERMGEFASAARLALEGLDLARRTRLRSCIADRAELIAQPIERLIEKGVLSLDEVTRDYWNSIIGGVAAARTPGDARQRLRMRLSPRQMQVLELLARGWSSKEIANRLGVGIGTVKAHRISLYRKLGVTRRSSAVAALEELR